MSIEDLHLRPFHALIYRLRRPCKISEVTPQNRLYPLEKVEAFERMASDKARFRVVLTMDN